MSRQDERKAPPRNRDEAFFSLGELAPRNHSQLGVSQLLCNLSAAYCPFFWGAVKSTFGTSRAWAVVTSKYSRGPFPITFAVSTCGNSRM